MTFLRRRQLPVLGTTLISESEMGISKRCWQLKIDGSEIEAFLLADPNLGAVLKVVIEGAGEAARAEELGATLREFLLAQGAMEAEEVSE
jgi:hypothetical protein